MHTVQEYALNEMKGDDADKKVFVLTVRVPVTNVKCFEKEDPQQLLHHH
jgi:hypothetical protein